MKKSDANLAKNASLISLATLIAEIDQRYHAGGLAIGAWALSTTLLGNALSMRKESAFEWVEMLRDNPEIFAEGIINSPDFQAAFVVCLENYVKERSSDKRVILRGIFMDFTRSQVDSSYPLERLNDITKNITFFDAKNFAYTVQLSSEQKTGQSFQPFGNEPRYVESVLSLIYLGLLIRDDVPRFIKENPSLIEMPRVFVSGLGIRYYEYVRNIPEIHAS